LEKLTNCGTESIVTLVQRSLAKWHVRVSKKSCKQANRLIPWGVGGAPQKKNSRFFLFFFLPKKLEKYDLTRPKMSKYSLIPAILRLVKRVLIPAILRLVKRVLERVDQRNKHDDCQSSVPAAPI
jgi:hypothetical protein